MTRIVATLDVLPEQQELRDAIEANTALRMQMGQQAIRELLDLVMHLSEARRVNSIWATTLFPVVLNSIEQQRRDLRPAIGRVRQALESFTYHGERIRPERMTESGYDTREEKRWER